MAELGELEKIKERLEAGERTRDVAQNSDLKKFALAIRQINNAIDQAKNKSHQDNQGSSLKIVGWFFKTNDKAKKEKISCDDSTLAIIAAKIHQAADRKESDLQKNVSEAIKILSDVGFFSQAQAQAINKEVDERLYANANATGWHSRNLFEVKNNQENNNYYLAKSKDFLDILKLLEIKGLARQVEGKYRVKNEEFQFVEKRGVFQTKFDVENGQDVEIKMDQNDIENKVKEYQELLKTKSRISNENDARHQNPSYKFLHILTDLGLNRQEMFAAKQNSKGEKLIEDKVGKKTYYFAQDDVVYEVMSDKTLKALSEKQLLENIDYYAKMADRLFEIDREKGVAMDGHSPQVLLDKMKQQLCDLASKDKIAINLADKKTYLPSDPEIDIGKSWAVRVMLLNNSQVVFSVKSPNSQPIHFKFGKNEQDDNFNQKLLEKLTNKNLTPADLDILSLESVTRGANANVGNNFYVLPTVSDLEEFVSKLDLANKSTPATSVTKSVSENLANKTANLAFRAVIV